MGRLFYVFIMIACLSLACAPRIATYSEYSNPDYDLRGYITTADPEVKECLKAILADDNDMRTDFRRIQDWVAGSIVYDSEISRHWRRPAETLSTRRGDCKDYSTLLCTLWRAYGIPADSVYVAIGRGTGAKQHAFLIEKYLTGKWQVIEPQTGGFMISFLGAIETAEKYAIMYLFNDLEYSGKPYWIYSRINDIDYPSAQAESTAKIPLPDINYFTAEPERISAGQSAMLKWDVQGADYIGIDQGIGEVDAVGTSVVYPVEDTEYRIVARNETGVLNSSVMVKVIGTAREVSIPQSPALVVDEKQPVTIGFNGWYSGEEQVDVTRAGRQVTAKVNIRGGNASQIVLRVWREVAEGRDDIVAQQSYNYDGNESELQINFAPSYAAGETGTLGYRLDLMLDGEQVWNLPEGYPPGLTVSPRPTTGSLIINFAGWRTGTSAVQEVRKGEPVVGSITMTGGKAGMYTLKVKRDVEGLNDQLVQQLDFNYDGSSCIQGMMFIPSIATGESSTRGYYLELTQDNKYVWNLSGNYPPRLVVTQ